MSENYSVIAVGSKEFVLPYGAAGLDYKETEEADELFSFIESKETAKTLFIVEEDIIKNVESVIEAERKGANILLVKAWGISEMANKKIREASIKAIGIDMIKEEEDE